MESAYMSTGMSSPLSSFFLPSFFLEAFPFSLVRTAPAGFPSFSNRDSKGNHKVIGSLIATQKATTKLSVSRDFFFTSHFPSSTAPQAFPRPDRGDAHAVERKVASRLAALAATARLGLDATEHDGTLLRSGFSFLS